MGGLPVPKPSILDNFRVVGIEGGRKVYKDDSENIFYTWDSLHGELEAFNKNGRHLGVVCPHTGFLIKRSVKGRRINKQN
ncbi:colicin E3/pyocin S6 family cytotoxin [Nitrosomonas cryotolerans]|uniref:colicin E3/pyocin S6 family cytotoxin n=1 Tax=Nitrosomonas cryotolerans TaxID=44575 RepID=UPI00094077D2